MLSIIYNPINSTILVGGNSGEILIWAMQDLIFVGYLQGHEDAVTCMALDQNYLFTGSDDKSIRVWELVNNTFLFSLDRHTSSVKGLMIIAQTGNLISCGRDGKLFVWNYMSRDVIKEVETVSELNCIGFLTYQNIILIGTEQHSIMTINLPPALGNPNGKDNTINRPKAHMEKMAKRGRGEEAVLNDDTRSIDSEDLLEPLPDPTEEMLRDLLIKSRKDNA